MDKNSKDTKHTRHIYITVHFVRNGFKLKIHQINWFEGDLKLEDIANNNVCENDLNPRMRYIMLRLDNGYRTLVQ